MFDRIDNIAPEIYHFAEFDRLGFKAFVTGRRGGVSLPPYDSLNTSASVGDDADCVKENIGRIEKAIELDHIWMPSQVHGDTIVTVTEHSHIGSVEADAVVVAERGTPIGVRTADCLPLLLMDPVRKVAAAVHAGRQSTELQITLKTINFMVERFDVDPATVYAAIGPCIRSRCYEVDGATAKKFAECCGGAYGRTLDIAAANLRQLSEAGILNEKVYDCKICTACENHRFFSYRKNKKITGRFITGIAIC